MKNVFIKYLEYLANANEKEALTLEKVLFTVLQASDRDVELIEKARQKNQGGFLWGYFGGGQQLSAIVGKPLRMGKGGAGVAETGAAGGEVGNAAGQ